MNARLNILLVEDDKQHADAVRNYLQKKDYDVAVTRTFDAARSLLELNPELERPFTLMILDLNLGTGPREGYRLLAWIREKKGYAMPVIVLTGSERKHAMHTLKYANDFVIKEGVDDQKEISLKIDTLEELALRIHRRTAPSEDSEARANPIVRGSLVFDPYEKIVHYRGKPLSDERQLRPAEFSVLHYLAENPNRLTSALILKRRLGITSVESVHSHIRAIRQKIPYDVISTRMSRNDRGSRFALYRFNIDLEGHRRR